MYSPRFLLSVLLFLGLSLSLVGQISRNRQDTYQGREYEGERFIDQLWLGAGGQLFFTSNGQFNYFVVGLSPMVGYKFTPSVSIGPRISLNYNAFRCDFNNVRSNYLTWEAGVFGRVRAFQQFFAHAEFNLENRRLIVACDEPLQQRISVPYLGAGYTSGGMGGVGFETSILFRLRNDGQGFVQQPFIFRGALNYNF